MQKDTTRVVIMTESLRIEGDIGLLPGVRLTDYMTKASIFIAVTNVTVADYNGNQRLSAPFINVHRDKINLVMPLAEQSDQ